MKRHLISVLAALSCAVLVAIPVVAAEKSTPVAGTTNHMATVRHAWPRETITGKITQVEPEQHLIIVQSSGEVPFDMIVTGKTRIVSGNRTLALKDLATDKDRAVTITFVPQRRGDVAESIHING